MWRALQQQQPGSIPAKVERSIAAMEECLLQYPLYQPQVSCRGNQNTAAAAAAAAVRASGALLQHLMKLCMALQLHGRLNNLLEWDL
jgi:hypothetical protein